MNCGDSLISRQSEYIHTNKLFNLGAQTIAESAFTSEMVILCPSIQCCKTFKNITDLHSHIEDELSHNILPPNKLLILHAPETKIVRNKCPHCYRNFISPNTLSRHYCKGERENRCGICVAAGQYRNFKSSHELSQHIKTDHPLNDGGGEDGNNRIWHKTGEWSGKSREKTAAKLRNKNKSATSFLVGTPNATIRQLTMVSELNSNNLNEVLTKVDLKQLGTEVSFSETL